MGSGYGEMTKRPEAGGQHADMQRTRGREDKAGQVPNRSKRSAKVEIAIVRLQTGDAEDAGRRGGITRKRVGAKKAQQHRARLTHRAHEKRAGSAPPTRPWSIVYRPYERNPQGDTTLTRRHGPPTTWQGNQRRTARLRWRSEGMRINRDALKPRGVGLNTHPAAWRTRWDVLRLMCAVWRVR